MLVWRDLQVPQAWHIPKDENTSSPPKVIIISLIFWHLMFLVKYGHQIIIIFKVYLI
jgi:hypothetical protein